MPETLTSLLWFNTCSKSVGFVGRSPMLPVLCFDTEMEPSVQSCVRAHRKYEKKISIDVSSEGNLFVQRVSH